MTTSSFKTPTQNSQSKRNPNNKNWVKIPIIRVFYLEKKQRKPDYINTITDFKLRI